MFTITMADDKSISGGDWADLPVDVVVKSLGCHLVMKNNDEVINLSDDWISGYTRYGFQKYDVISMDGTKSHGVQLIGVDDDANAFMTLDINLLTGHRTSRWLPVKELTYNPELLRRGAGRR